jgi:hypothetical protein
MTDGQSVFLGVKFTLELVTRYYSLSESCCVVSVGRPLWREVGSVSCQSLSSVFSPLSMIQNAKYTRPLSAQAQYSRSCQNLRCNSNLVAWTVVRLTATKFKPLMFSVTIAWSWSASCGRQTVNQCVWVSGLSLGPLTRFYLALLTSSDSYFFLLSKMPSLTRKWVCSLQCDHSLVGLLTSSNHTLPSHLRLCSLFVASWLLLMWKVRT